MRQRTHRRKGGGEKMVADVEEEQDGQEGGSTVKVRSRQRSKAGLLQEVAAFLRPLQLGPHQDPRPRSQDARVSRGPLQQRFVDGLQRIQGVQHYILTAYGLLKFLPSSSPLSNPSPNDSCPLQPSLATLGGILHASPPFPRATVPALSDPPLRF